MGIDFGSLIIDLEELVSNSKEDFSNESWSSYENYLKTYNKLLTDIQSLGFYKELKTIKTVPFSEQTFDSGFSKQEKAKLREITNASNNLLRKVKLLLSPPMKPSFNNKIRSNKIFLAYEKNNTIKTDIEKKLEQLELKPILIEKNQNLKKSIIETITENPQISFAVVIFSPNNSTQNLFFELGYFIGKLGAKNVAAIYQKNNDFKIPKDNDEIQWIEYKSNWYFKLIKQLQTCHFNVDANKLGWL